MLPFPAVVMVLHQERPRHVGVALADGGAQTPVNGVTEVGGVQWPALDS